METVVTPSIESLAVAVCGLRPEGSAAHLAAFAFAIGLAWWFSPRSHAESRPVRSGR